MYIFTQNHGQIQLTTIENHTRQAYTKNPAYLQSQSKLSATTQKKQYETVAAAMGIDALTIRCTNPASMNYGKLFPFAGLVHLLLVSITRQTIDTAPPFARGANRPQGTNDRTFHHYH